MPWIQISQQKCLKLLVGVAGPFFEPHPSNLVRINFYLSCKNTEIFVVISQVVSNLAKISVSVPSISWGVLVSSNRSRSQAVFCVSTLRMCLRIFCSNIGNSILKEMKLLPMPKKWNDPFDSVWLKLITLLVYSIELVDSVIMMAFVVYETKGLAGHYRTLINQLLSLLYGGVSICEILLYFCIRLSY